jgi:hypothetical protein
MKKNLSNLKFDPNSKLKTTLAKLIWPYKSVDTRELIGEIRACRDTLAIALDADRHQL